MTVTTEDRRVRRTQRALRQAIVDLVLEQGYDAITVDGIADRADITRATFYAHYVNKENLLENVVDNFADQVLAEFEQHLDAVPAVNKIEILLRQAAKSRDVMRIILRGEGNGAVLRRFTQRIESVIAGQLIARQSVTNVQPRVHIDLLVSMRASQIVAAVSWFIDQPQADPAQISRQVNRIVELGALWAEGDERQDTNSPAAAVGAL